MVGSGRSSSLSDVSMGEGKKQGGSCYIGDTVSTVCH